MKFQGDRAGAAMASDQSPHANVQVLRNLFNDKDILPMRMLRSGDLHPSLTKEPAGTETSPPPPSGVRIPRPTLAPKPSRPALPTVSIRVQQPTSVRNDGTDNSPSSTRERADRRSPKPDAVHAPSPPPPATPKKSPDVAKPRLLPVVSLCRKKDGQGTADERLCKKDSSPKENYCPKGGYLSRREYISDAGYASRKGPPSNSDSRLDKSSVSNEDSLSRGSLDLPEASDSGSVRSSSGSGRRSDGGERESTWRRRSLPPPTGLPAPPKPPRTDAMRLPPGLTPPPQDARLGDLAQRERPPVPARAVPTKPPPQPPSLPPPRATPPRPPVGGPEEEDLYGDTEVPRQPSSPIPEYTEDEELGRGSEEELYADTDRDEAPVLPPARSARPIAPPPTSYPPTTGSTSPAEELYQDSTLGQEEEMYEEMPMDQEKRHSSTASDKADRSAKKEGKSKDKKDRESEKLRKKFGLEGGEEPLDTGRARRSSRGGRLDLALRGGEAVLILRMDRNPPGKWLVKNDRGDVGYVELTNIEVDAESIKFVMTSRKALSPNYDKEPSDSPLIDDEEEAIYEETY
ncbi:putative fyn-binding protein [Ixodes scapularis]